MDKELLSKITDLHNNDLHGEIINILLSIPEPEMDYEMRGLLARAYNNKEEYNKALEILLSLENEGKGDSLWHFRIGYAYFYTDEFEKAKTMFEKSLELNPDEEDAETFIQWCDEEINNEKYDPELYPENEVDIVEAHIQNSFGHFSHVFHEIISPDIHVDIAIIDPAPGRDFYTLVTIGMGAHRMSVPQELKKDGLDRGELMITLPSYWKMDNEDETWYWPVRLLKALARMPGEEDTWFGFGHTIAYSKPFAESVSFTGAILTYPCVNIKRLRAMDIPGDWSLSACKMADGSSVNFYQVIPLYKEEIDYKVAAGTDALWSKFGSDVSHILDVNRKNACGSSSLDAKDFLKRDNSDGGRFAAYTTIGSNGGVYVGVSVPSEKNSEEYLERLIPFIKENIEWLAENKDEIEKALIEAQIPKLASEHARKGRKIENDMGECYMLPDGETVLVPVTEKVFCESVYCDGVSFDFDNAEPEIFVYVRTFPDYFNGRYITLYMDRDRNLIFEDISDE